MQLPRGRRVQCTLLALAVAGLGGAASSDAMAGAVESNIRAAATVAVGWPGSPELALASLEGRANARTGNPHRNAFGGALRKRASTASHRRRSARRRAAARHAMRIGKLAVHVALRERGVPYESGGSSPSGFDCSGLVARAYGRLGISLPHFTGSLWNSGVHVPAGHLNPGDLVFFDGESHVGICIGHGRFVHAPHTGNAVKVSRLNESWYSNGYDGAVRVA